MVNPYQGHFLYNQSSVSGWDSSAIGVYYCGYVNAQNVLVTHYVGRAVGNGGIRERLLQHLRDDYWPDVGAFGFCLCGTANEAIALEASEIRRLQPKYNTVGV